VRICSFLPSATEILYALGLEEEVVGVTYTCDFPPAARRKPVVVRTRLTPTDSPADLDREVSDFVARGESLYQVDLEAVERLAPDLILTQDLCHVCAASPEDLSQAVARLPRPPQVISITPRSLGQVFEDIRRVGAATGRVEAAERLVAKSEALIADIERSVAGADRPRVLCLEWLDPPYVGGHWVPEMVARAGGTDVLGCAGEPSHRVTWQEVLVNRPEVIVVMPCGYDLGQTMAEFKRTALPAGWEQLPAVKAGRVFAVDATSYFSRPGPRLAAGVGLLARVLHPGRVSYSAPPDSVATL